VVGDTHGAVTTYIHMTQMDFDTITEHGALAKANGALGATEFEHVMHRQVIYYIKRRLHRSITETETQQDFASLSSLKALVMDVDSLKRYSHFACFTGTKVQILTQKRAAEEKCMLLSATSVSQFTMQLPHSLPLLTSSENTWVHHNYGRNPSAPLRIERRESGRRRRSCRGGGGSSSSKMRGCHTWRGCGWKSGRGSGVGVDADVTALERRRA
jgi:hypothetical protein